MRKVVIAMMLLVGVTTLAQRGERNNRGGMKDLSPEQMATLQTKKATLALDLTEAQQAQMKALFIENAKIRKAKMEEKQARKEREDATKPTSEERYAMANRRLDLQIAQKEKIKQILSEEQMEKWEKIQHRRGKHGKGKRSKSQKKQRK
ncbi:MAG: hypothetical protein ABJN95_08965 [Maribacter sp.]|uniref:hypothetical protein n=1 Tax=Maribacter sp. TaxID=1897614 RepID=UPI0032973377